MHKLPPLRPLNPEAREAALAAFEFSEGVTITRERAILSPLPRKNLRFQLLLADPGWSYNQGGRGAINDRYTQSGPAAIHGLDVPSIVEDNAVLFLWGTWPQLPIVMATFPAWGFEYKTVGFVWVKYHKGKPCKKCRGNGWTYPSNAALRTRDWCADCNGSGAIDGKRRVGGGFWTRANTEFCLIGVRGENHPTRVSKAIRQLIETDDDEEQKQLVAPCPTYPNGKVIHSAKPPEARERIVQLMGDIPRIELYARERTPGWAVWGDDKRLGKPDVDLKIRGQL